MAKGKGGNKKKKKEAKVGSTPSPQKTVPAWATAPTHGDRRLSWSFSAVDNGGTWAWSNLPDDRWPEIIKKLTSFETMDLHSLKNFRSFHALSSLEKAAQQRLLDIDKDDVERLIAFHISGAERIWCREYDSIMFVLWWDPLHTVYKVAKKHT